MFDYNTIVTDDELTMRFEKTDNTELRAFSKDSDEPEGFVFLEGHTFSASSDDIFMQYKLWMTRPERCIGRPIKLEGKNVEQLAEFYDELLIGAYILNKPNEKVMPGGVNGFCKMIDWLRSTDFYICPASTRYHDSYPGGLLTHTLRVYNRAMSLLQLPEFKNIDVVSATLVALVHDWCKIGLYETYEKNVKDDATGQWKKVSAYKRNQRGVPLGHGTSSMFLASKFFRLSAEEACAIRWHMGRFNVCETEINEFQLCNEKFPLVLFLQFADHLSITDYANNE